MVGVGELGRKNQVIDPGYRLKISLDGQERTGIIYAGT
jgi:hypothetical protein